MERNPEDDVCDEIERLVNASLARPIVDDYSINRYDRCEKCRGEWHGLPVGGCPGSDDKLPPLPRPGPAMPDDPQFDDFPQRVLLGINQTAPWVVYHDEPTTYVDQVQSVAYTISDLERLRSRPRPQMRFWASDALGRTWMLDGHIDVREVTFTPEAVTLTAQIHHLRHLMVDLGEAIAGLANAFAPLAEMLEGMVNVEGEIDGELQQLGYIPEDAITTIEHQVFQDGRTEPLESRFDTEITFDVEHFDPQLRRLTGLDGPR